jgi:anti-anti-sigma factor
MDGENRIEPGSARRGRLRERMLSQTEADINAYLRRRQVPWPHHCEPRDRGPNYGELFGLAGHVTAVAALRVRRSQSAAQVVEIRGDDRGYLDQTRVRELESLLIGLAAPGRRGHLVIDLSHVRSLNTLFLKVVAAVQERLKDQRRRVALCGLRPRCTEVLRANGLKPVVECYVTERQALDAFAVQ